MLEEKILRNIVNNSKISSEDLGAMLGATTEEINAAIKKMEDEGIICGYPTVINWDKTEEEVVTALIEVNVTPQRGQGFDKVAERIYQFDEVESVYLISGGFDLCVTITGKSMKEVALFVVTKLSPLESVVGTSTNFVLKKYKERGLIIDKDKEKDERMLISP